MGVSLWHGYTYHGGLEHGGKPQRQDLADDLLCRPRVLLGRHVDEPLHAVDLRRLDESVIRSRATYRCSMPRFAVKSSALIEALLDNRREIPKKRLFGPAASGHDVENKTEAC